jgi:hypothetical protein
MHDDTLVSASTFMALLMVLNTATAQQASLLVVLRSCSIGMHASAITSVCMPVLCPAKYSTAPSRSCCATCCRALLLLLQYDGPPLPDDEAEGEEEAGEGQQQAAGAAAAVGLSKKSGGKGPQYAGTFSWCGAAPRQLHTFCTCTAVVARDRSTMQAALHLQPPAGVPVVIFTLR